jgi:hypothetical protein
MQSALTAKASEEAVQARQAAEHDSAELRSSLQQERARAERLESDLTFAQRKNDAPSPKDSTASPKAVTVGQIARDKPVDAKPIAARLVARGSALVGQGDIGRRDSCWSAPPTWAVFRQASRSPKLMIR